MNTLFIGVDGGATKTKVRVENQAGDLLGEGVGGPSNIRLSVDQAWESIYSALDEALKRAQIELHDKQNQFHVGLGLAGCEVKQVVDAFVARPHPFARLKLVSDAHTACLGAHAGKDGAIIIVGTGVVGYAIDRGKSVRVSGWGFPCDDEGGGAWLGLEAARLALQAFDGRAEKSSLSNAVFAFFENNIEKMIAWTNSANSSEFARLAPLVIQHAKQKETAALFLMQKAAEAVDRVGLTLMNKQHPLPCSLFGGIAPFIEPFLCDTLRACLVPQQADASQGAILLIRNNIT